MYSPIIGRFAQRDPIQADANLYRYVDGNPANWTDPSGMSGGGMWEATPWQNPDDEPFSEEIQCAFADSDPAPGLKQMLKQATADTITASAERLAKFVEDHPDLFSANNLEQLNPEVDALRAAAQNVVNTNPKTMGWMDLSIAWLLELGPTDWKFGDDDAISADVLKLKGVKEAIGTMRDRYKTTKFAHMAQIEPVDKQVKFGVEDFYTAIGGMDKAFLFLGSYRCQAGYGNGQIQITVTNTSGWESGTRFRKAAKPGGQHQSFFKDRQRTDPGIHLGGNIKQTFTIHVPWDEEQK